MIPAVNNSQYNPNFKGLYFNSLKSERLFKEMLSELSPEKLGKCKQYLERLKASSVDTILCNRKMCGQVADDHFMAQIGEKQVWNTFNITLDGYLKKCVKEADAQEAANWARYINEGKVSIKEAVDAIFE